MNDRDFFVSHLWDWIAEGDAHPENSRMQELLKASPELLAEWEQVRSIKQGLCDPQLSAPEGFESRLKNRLQQHMAEETQAPEVESVATIVTPPRSFWSRGGTLLLSGVAAALLLTFVARQDNGSGTSAAVQSQQLAATAQQEEPATGLLAKHDYQSYQDSTASDSLLDKVTSDDLKAVSATREHE